MSTEKKRRYTHVKELRTIIEERVAQGRTKREIAEELGLPGKETVRAYLKRKRKAQKAETAGREGRPKKKPINELVALQRENQRLRMEVELLRSFHQESERG